MKNSKRYDSILTTKEIYSWFWFNKKPVNYSPKILPRSQDAKPIIQETTGLYGSQKKNHSKHGGIDAKTNFYNNSNNETIDLDNHEDFETLKQYAKKNLFIENSLDIDLILKNLNFEGVIFVPLNLETFLFVRKNLKHLIFKKI